MARVLLDSYVSAIVGVLLLIPSTVLAGQNLRQRGDASSEGQGRPRFGVSAAPDQTTPQAARPEAHRAEPPRNDVAPRAPSPRRTDGAYGEGVAIPRTTPRVVTPQVVIPQTVPQFNTLRPNDHPVYRPNYRPDYRPRYQPHNYAVHPGYRPYHRPYYSFLPQVRVGASLWIGFPVKYPTYFHPYTALPFAYTYPYPNTSPYPSTIYPTQGVAVGAAGGLSFEITPEEAGVYVDGQYVGMVGQFTPNQPPLALSPGRHHVEIRSPGFEIIAFDVDILPGQVIPYRGELRRF
jgi:hypothetical protein